MVLNILKMWYEIGWLILLSVAVFLNNVMNHLFSSKVGHFFEMLNHCQLVKNYIVYLSKLDHEYSHSV